MKNSTKYIIAIGAGLLILISGLSIFRIAGKKTGPDSGEQEILKEFYYSLCHGDFDAAESLCDTLEMNDYMERLRSRWDKNDSTVMTIVPAILAETEIKITDVMRSSQERTVLYELTATDGTSKEKVAIIRRHEGEWRIKAITDRH